MSGAKNGKLHITNGEYFNEYIKTKEEGTFIPFSEAMIQGNPTLPIFSNVFVLERCKTHNVSEKLYREKMRAYFSFITNLTEYDELRLWFGEDTFCQMNLLTLLAHLEQENYKGKIFLTIIDDETRRILKEVGQVRVEGALTAYKTLFLDGGETSFSLQSINNASLEYLRLKNGDNELALYVRNNKGKERQRLLIDLLDLGKKYGLSVEMAEKIIDSEL